MQHRNIMMDDHVARNVGNILAGQRLGEIDDINTFRNCCAMATGDVFSNLTANPYADSDDKTAWDAGYNGTAFTDNYANSKAAFDAGAKARKADKLDNIFDIANKGIETATKGVDLVNKGKDFFKKDTTKGGGSTVDINPKTGKPKMDSEKRNLIIAGSVIGGVVLVTAIVYFIKKSKKGKKA